MRNNIRVDMLKTCLPFLFLAGCGGATLPTFEPSYTCTLQMGVRVESEREVSCHQFQAAFDVARSMLVETGEVPVEQLDKTLPGLEIWVYDEYTIRRDHVGEYVSYGCKGGRVMLSKWAPVALAHELLHHVDVCVNNLDYAESVSHPNWNERRYNLISNEFDLWVFFFGGAK